MGLRKGCEGPEAEARQSYPCQHNASCSEEEVMGSGGGGLGERELRPEPIAITELVHHSSSSRRLSQPAHPFTRAMQHAPGGNTKSTKDTQNTKLYLP